MASRERSIMMEQQAIKRYLSTGYFIKGTFLYATCVMKNIILVFTLIMSTIYLFFITLFNKETFSNKYFLFLGMMLMLRRPS